jgi:hypothetical protein
MTALSGFRIASQYTLDELMVTSTDEPDAMDMQTWSISAEEWDDAINAALLERHSTLLHP